MVKTLREETGLGMMDCKKALDETAGDMEAAKDLLRKKGMTTAEKKAGRATSEGMVAIRVNAEKTSAAMVMVRCETDFCARNDVFKQMVGEIADEAMKAADGAIPASPRVTERVQAALAKIGENMSYGKGIKLSAGRVGTYVHHNGKVGVLIAVDGPVEDAVLADLCMHIAFADPLAVSKNDVPAELIAKEREIATAQAAESGKPANIIEKMVEGKVNKFLEANALIEQPFVRDDKKKVKDILGAATVRAFARFDVGSSK